MNGWFGNIEAAQLGAAFSLHSDVVPVRLVVAGVLTPVDGTELQETETGGALSTVAAEARGSALHLI